MDDEDDPLLNRKQAARRIKRSPNSLATWDSRKTYDLKPEKRRGRTYYRQSILDAFLVRRLIRN